jgi:hypothetical protein
MAQYYEGFCRLCGRYGKLSFEHIPPKKAFNDHQQLLRTMEDHLSKRSYSRFRKGLGSYSLCERCNNYTGAWYGQAFVAWTRQGYDWLDKVHGEKMLNLPYYIRPLNVLKQVLVMAMAMSTEVSLNAHRDVRQFLLSPRQRHLPLDYRAFVYFGMKGQLRFNSGMALLDTEGKGADFIMAEVALPPFGYYVTRPVGDRPSLAESKGLYDISWFANYGFNEWTQVHLRIPTRETHFPSPLDYRNLQGIEEV